MRPVNKNIPSHIAVQIAESASFTREVIRTALIDSIGHYCSYCEMSLAGYEIEHLRHLRNWPEYISMSMWSDLLLICNDCRANILVPELTAISTATLLWPDKDITFNVYNSPLLYELRQIKYVVINMEEERISEEDMRLVFVVANPRTDTNTYQKAINTIQHFQLNMKLEYYDAATNELRIPELVHLQRADNRIFKRTEAWFDAVAAVEGLRSIENEDSDAALRPIIRQNYLEQIGKLAKWSGNWSVWMTVLHEHLQDHELLKSAMINDPFNFPGTRNDNNILFQAE